jgi:hypothetical protein
MATRTIRVDATACYDDFPMDVAVMQALAELASGGHEKTVENMRREIRTMADELVGPGATSVEHHLGTTAAICWFMMRLYELQSVVKEDQAFVRGSLLHQRRIDAVYGRYLRTLKELRRVQSRYDLSSRRDDHRRGQEVVEELLTAPSQESLDREFYDTYSDGGYEAYLPFLSRLPKVISQ